MFEYCPEPENFFEPDNRLFDDVATMFAKQLVKHPVVETLWLIDIQDRLVTAPDLLISHKLLIAQVTTEAALTYYKECIQYDADSSSAVDFSTLAKQQLELPTDAAAAVEAFYEYVDKASIDKLSKYSLAIAQEIDKGYVSELLQAIKLMLVPTLGERAYAWEDVDRTPVHYESWIDERVIRRCVDEIYLWSGYDSGCPPLDGISFDNPQTFWSDSPRFDSDQ